MNMTAIYREISGNKSIWEASKEDFEKEIEKKILEAFKGDVVLDKENRPCIWIDNTGSYYSDKNFGFRLSQIHKIEILEQRGSNNFFIRIVG